jgi:hypothetical protein
MADRSHTQKASRTFLRSGLPGRPRAGTDPRPQIEWGLKLSGSRYWVDFEIVRALAWSAEGETLGWFAEVDGCPSGVPFESAMPFLKGHVKWDGCTELGFGSDDGRLHFCSAAADAAELAIVWQWALRKAHELMLELGGDVEWKPMPEATPYHEEAAAPALPGPVNP